MNAFDQCPECGVFDFLPRHICPPRWLVSCDEDESEWQAVYAVNEGAAATRFIEEMESNNSEYDSMKGRAYKVRVRGENSGGTKAFSVRGYLTIFYQANEIPA